jgi:hypothetical protein
MKSKDIFKLAIRLLGLVFLYHGLMAVPAAIPLVLSFDFRSLLIGVVMVGWPLAVASWLVGGAPALMRRAYPENAEED